MPDYRVFGVAERTGGMNAPTPILLPVSRSFASRWRGTGVRRHLISFIVSFLVLYAFQVTAWSQLRDYAVHKRGVLHETVFNTGEIGRGYHQGQAGNRTNVPLMEWPGFSQTIVDGVEYDGQHNIVGGGMWLAADAPDTTVRMIAFCGAVGSNAPELVAGKWSYPLVLHRRENYPVLSNGDLNPAYNPDDAEEIITTKWATPTGLTVTRVSRAWSYPDYDDFIIYEYEIENTGDRDGNPLTKESNATLTDVLINFAYGFAPSMFGYQRVYNRYLYTDFERKDQRARFDRTRWLNYNIDMDAKPDPQYREEWGRTGRNGGGLTAPAAVGFSVLYYDVQHLARHGETKVIMSSTDSALVWDPLTGRIKQPWTNRLETSNLRSSKMADQLLIDPRRNPPYRNRTVFGEEWVGRGTFNHRQTRKAVGRIMMFGPYTIKSGEKVRFAVAEVAGYGAARLEETLAGLRDEGGSCGEDCGEPSDSAFYPVPNWSQPLTYGGATGNAFTYGSTYLRTHPPPSYVNSGVVTIRDVADKAKHAYTGDAAPPPYWPDRFPDRGVYKLPMPVPAPSIHLSSNALAENEVTWGPQVESFTHSRLLGSFSHYEVYKAAHPLGPWARLDSVGKADPRYFSNGMYRILDRSTRVGESFYYAVVSVDHKQNRSGKSNLTLHETQLGGLEVLGKVYAVPNPFFVRSGFAGGGEAESRIGFYNLPKRCTIRIYSFAGQLVTSIEHESELYSTAWLQVTRNEQVIASGLYFFVVETADGKTSTGKFVVVR